jgi:hypothetical protein
MQICQYQQQFSDYNGQEVWPMSCCQQFAKTFGVKSKERLAIISAALTEKAGRCGAVADVVAYRSKQKERAQAALKLLRGGADEVGGLTNHPTV